MSLLLGRGLHCERDGERLFAPVDIDLQPGRWMMLEGANGIGKSTLLRALVGLHALLGDGLHFDGQPVLDDRSPLLANTWLLGHALAQKRDLTVLDNARFALGMAGQSVDAERLAPQAAALGLQGYEDAKLRTLSAGLKKRAALLPLALSPARLWLLDEPFANLDATGIDRVDALLASHLQRGGAAIVTSHGVLRGARVPDHVLRLAPP